MPAVVHVEGLRQLQTALAKADRDTRLGVRKELRNVAEPVQSTAERLAQSSIRRIGPRWSRMRIGLTRDVVYVAPARRGARRQPSSRPNLAPLLMNRAMLPALGAHEAEIEGRFENFLDTVADDFNHGTF